MKILTRALRIAARVLFLLGVLLVTASPSDARGHGRGHGHGRHGHHGRHFHHFVGVGPWWWGPPWWYYPPPYYVYGPPVIVQQPPVYIQQSLPGYWYYCPSAEGEGYYPTVPSCPEVWVRVAPRSQ